MNRSYNLHGSRPERGASLVEYAISAAILVAVFAVAGKVLYDAALARGEKSADTVKSAVPCESGSPLSTAGVDACL